MKEVIKRVNELLADEYQFNLDPIYSTPNRLLKYELLGYTNTVYKDTSICLFKINPEIYFTLMLEQRLILKKIEKWINDKLFNFILVLLFNKKINWKTESVRIRIFTSLIMKIDFLNKEDKLEWIDRIKMIYYARKWAINEYYSKEILKLPF